MPEEKPAIFSERVQAGRLDYFLDVREAANGSVFLSMTQCRRQPAPDRGRTSRVYVFEDGLDPFRKAFWAALRSMKKEIEARREADLGQMRASYPRAFEKWSADEEDTLRALFAERGAPALVAPLMGRTERAISLRLQKLGLIPEETLPSTEDSQTRTAGPSALRSQATA